MVFVSIESISTDFIGPFFVVLYNILQIKGFFLVFHIFFFTFFNTLVFLCQQGYDAHVKYHGQYIVGRDDKRSCSNGRVYLHFVERKRYKGSEDGCKHNYGKQTE